MTPPGRVALFVSCAADLAMSDVVSDTAEVLEAAGFTVDVPSAQTCCGQVALNAGHRTEARTLMRHWLDVFAPYDAVVSPSGSCAATVHHQFPRVLEGLEGAGGRGGAAPSAAPAVSAARAHDLAAKTYELTQLLAACGPDRLDALDLALEADVAWHDSCHMLRSLGERDAPRTVLGHVRGLTLHEARDHDVCCGFGGTFATTFPELSCTMADRKLAGARAAGAGGAGGGVTALVSADPGCLLHLGGRARATGTDLRAWHVASLLRAALPDRRGAGLDGVGSTFAARAAHTAGVAGPSGAAHVTGSTR